MTRDLRVLNLELCEERSRTLGMGWNLPEQVRLQADEIASAVEADANGEQQLKRTQSGSSSRSGRNRGAVEIGEEQLKRMQVASSS